MEKIFALQGSIGGTARVHIESGRTALRFCTVRELPEGCTVYLLCNGALKAFPINGAAGGAEEELSPEALLVAAGETILAEGGFAGKKEARRDAEFRLRLIAQSAKAHREETKKTTETDAAVNTSAIDAPSAAVEAAETKAENEADDPVGHNYSNNYNEEKPSKNQHGQNPRPCAAAHAPCANAFPDALSEILRRAQTLFGPLREACEAASVQDGGAAAPGAAEAVNAPSAAPPFQPFSDFYPEAEWRKVPYPGTSRCYLEGRVRAERLVLHGIPGEYAPVPPVPGFKRFLRDRDGCGYWLRIRKI